jgi:hypothetical protein
MNDDFASDLPAPRDDEPSSLRDDIRDELADHLACSIHREELSGSSAEVAKENALARFGNPAQVARQMWLEAMKGKIMVQKLTTAVAIVISICCLAAVVLLWRATEDGRHATALLVDKIADIQSSKSPVPISVSEWGHVRVLLLSGSESGPRVKGISVELSGNLYSSGANVTATEKTDASGIADFGVVRVGETMINVQMPWQEFCSLQVIVKPGDEIVKRIICPERPPVSSHITPILEVPADLQERDIAYSLGVRNCSTRILDDCEWSTPWMNWHFQFDQHGKLNKILESSQKALPRPDFEEEGKLHLPSEPLFMGNIFMVDALWACTEASQIKNEGQYHSTISLGVQENFREEYEKESVWTIPITNYVSQLRRDSNPKKIQEMKERFERRLHKERQDEAAAAE